MRKYILAVILLVAAGIGVSLYLIPSEQEVARMQSYDAANSVGGVIEGAEGRFIDGDRSAPVMMAVADQYLSAGNDIRPLIPEYEKFVQQNPDNMSVRVRLARMYRVAENHRGYLEQMLIVVENEPNEQHLFMLSDAYNINKAYPEQEETLKRLVELSGGSNPEYYADLATIQALLGKDQAVLETVQALKARHPDYASYKITRIVVQSYTNSGQLEEALSEANLWIAKEVEPQQIAELTNILNYGGRPDMAVQLSEPHRVMADNHPVLMMSYINALVAHHEEPKAYAILKEDHEGKNLDSSLYYPFMRLAILLEPEYALPIPDTLNPEIFEQDEALDLLELTYVVEHEALRDRLVILFDVEPFKTEKDVLQAVIALIRRDDDEDLKIEKALANLLPENERLRLAESCARHRKEACFNEVVSRYPAFPEMTPRELDEIVSLYIAAERPSEISDPINEQATLRALTIVNYAAARLAAANGDQERVETWLQRDGVTASSTDIATLYFVANDSRQLNVATTIAEVLYQREPSERHLEYLSSAYVREGSVEKALPLLREAMKSNPKENEDSYLTALISLAPQDEQYRTELREYVLPQMDSDEITVERKYELVFALINSRQMEVAKPYINQYAKSEGGEWQVLYNQVYSVASAGGGAKPVVALVDRPRDFRVNVARSANTKDSVKRMIGFSLLDDGYREDAVNIFFDLAQTATANSQAVEDLLYLWGPRLNEQQIGWLTQRADNAPTQAERIAWAERIANSTDDFGLMRYVSNHPDMLNHPALRKRYFVAMAEYSDKARFVDGMKPWINATDDTSALQDYAAAAIGGTFPDGAIYALRRIESIDPNHLWAQKQLTVLNYGRADYSEAERNAAQYMSSAQQAPEQEVSSDDNSPFEVLFYKAGLLKRAGDMQGAMAHYQQVANRGEREATTASKQTLYYNSLYQLGHRETAKQGFETLIQTYPRDKGLLADYLQMLIDGNEVTAARAVANHYDNNGNSAKTPRVMPVDATGVQSIIPHENGREMELRYQQEVPRSLMPKSLSAEGWVEGVARGQNSIVIAAKPGYVLRFVPTSATQSEIVAAPVRGSSPEERLEIQQQLRLQLLYARMELESGQIEQARDRIETIRPYFGDDVQYLGYAANVENAAGNWPKAMRLLSDAQNLGPENEDVARLYRDINRLYGQEIKVDHTWRSIADHEEQITTLSGRVRPTHNTELGMIVQNNFVDAVNIRRGTDGRIENYDGSRQRAELYGAYYFDNGDALRASLFANNDTPGAGLSYSFNNSLGRTEAFAEYHRPYWDFTEAVIEQTTRDSVGVHHIANLDARTNLSVRGSLNNYNTEVTDDATQSGRLELYIARRIYDGSPNVSVGYGFDGEYLYGYDHRFDANGNGYRTLPLVSREIHYPFVTLSEDLTEDTYGEVTAGWAFDRLGEHGPQVSGRLTHDITDAIEAEVRASYGLQGNDSDQNVTQVGGHLKYQF